jgi:hypothetical protein
MTDTNLQAEPLNDDDLMPDLYVERTSRMIYECKIFDNFVLVRPATPKLYLSIRKINHEEFVNEFEEFCGNNKEIRDFLRGAEPELIIN